MSSLANLTDLVGFFSYARSDDEHLDADLSLLRRRIRAELRGQLGRELRLWQDTDAIPHGTAWKRQIAKAIGESAFFIPIVSPSLLNSRFCREEFEAFLARELKLGRDDLIFPILYIPVSGRANAGQHGWQDVLQIINARQYLDWTEMRLKDAGSVEVRTAVARFCADIAGALEKPWEPKREAVAGSPVPARDVATGGDVSQSVVLSGNSNISLQVSGDSNVVHVFRSDAAPQPGAPDGGAGDGRAAEAGAVSPARKPQRSRDLDSAIVGIAALIVGIALLVWEQRAPRSSSQPSPGDLGTSSTNPAPAPVTGAASTSASPLSSERERAVKPKDTFKECADCPEMVVVPAGSFAMGSTEKEDGRFSDEGPQHAVTIGRQFAVGKLHVTVDQFAAFVRDTGYEASSKCYVFEGGKWVERADRSWRNPGFAQEGSRPAVCLTWNDAKAYVDWMAKKTGKPYRMLSEAEWEYAARGRTSLGAYPRFWFGDDEKDLCRHGNGADQTARDGVVGLKGWTTFAPCNDGYAYTSPAGRYVPNAFGLYDMAGNAWQWTADCYHDSYNGAPADGSAWTTTCGSGRVVRGGSWYLNPWFLRSALRSKDTDEGNGGGFRLARTLTP